MDRSATNTRPTTRVVEGTNNTIKVVKYRAE